MTRAPTSWIERLCLVLAYRWEPTRLFVILIAYLDESGTHGGSPVTVMAGTMGTASQWRGYQTTVDSLKRKYGFKVFHTKEWKRPTGDFSGWPDDKLRAFFGELGKAGARLMQAVSCVLPNDLYDAHYRRTESDPPKLRLDSRYGLCFRVALTKLTSEAIRRLSTHKKFGETTLNVVLESGHKNAGDAERIFFEFKKELEATGCRLLGTLTFADKADCDPLWIADALSHGDFAMYGQKEAPDEPPLGPGQKATGMTTLTIEAEGMIAMKARLVSEFAARRKPSVSPGAAPSTSGEPS